MSLDSSFWIDTTETQARVQGMLVGTRQFTPLHDIKAVKRVAADGTVVAIMQGMLFRDQREALGIDPKLHLYFGCADNSKTAMWTRKTVIGAMTLLQLLKGDALLIYSSETPALLRKGGRITLDRRAGLWAGEVGAAVLPLVTLPYEFGEIPLVI